MAALRISQSRKAESILNKDSNNPNAIFGSQDLNLRIVIIPLTEER